MKRDMLVRTPPMSNAERQRRFRATHPGYNKRYRRSAGQLRADAAIFMAQLRQTPVADTSETTTVANLPEPLTYDI